MFDSIMNWFLGFDFTGQMGLLLYWAPMALCAYGYLMRTASRYRMCCAARDANEYFRSDTVGTLIGRAIVTFTPFMNVFAASVDIGPMVFGRFFSMIGRVFDKPLVSKAQD